MRARRLWDATAVGCLLALVLVAGGCGYHVVGSAMRAPGGIRSIRIGEFDNRTRQVGLERNLAFAF